jgi:dolichyl-phosphate-mannose--protein O-mannosyl transferase
VHGAKGDFGLSLYLHGRTSPRAPCFTVVLRGLRELVPSTVPLVGLVARPIHFAMALSTNVLRLSLLGFLVLTRSRWTMLVITMWFFTWVVVECMGGPSGLNLI